MVRAFALWDKNFRENPRGFASTVERILANEPSEIYGRECSEYLRSLLIETR